MAKLWPSSGEILTLYSKDEKMTLLRPATSLTGHKLATISQDIALATSILFKIQAHLHKMKLES